MRHTALPALTILALAGLAAAPARAASIGLAAPLSGSTALLGEQMRAGAEAAIAQAGGGARLETRDTACTAEGGSAAAESFVVAKVDAVTGFLCMEAIEAALPILTQAGIPVITTGVRVDSLTDRRERTGWPVFRLAPRADGELAAVSRLLAERWRDVLFAVVDDGTIYGRELAEGFRLAAEQTGLQPVFTDTFRPQLENQIGLAGRLRRAGATHVFAGGDRADIAILGRDAAELGYDLTIAGGEALRAARDEVDLAPGTLMVAPPEWAEIAAPGAVDRLAAAGVAPQGYVLPSHAAVEIALQAVRAAVEAGLPVAGAIGAGAFETALGTVRFDDRGDWAGDHYRLYRYDGDAFQPTD
jgi:branched-chain amino acid transport system substrate-binding protein